MSSNAIAIQGSSEGSVHLVARNTQEMAAAQGNLVSWLDAKVASFGTELAELTEAIAVAKRNKWGAATLQSQLRRAQGRILFYTKLKDATLAGYTIIPDMGAQTIAVRTKRDKPKEEIQSTTSTYTNAEVSEEKPQLLPSGEGEYKSPLKTMNRWEANEKDKEGKSIVRKFAQACEFQDIAFPVIAALPAVMNATQEAMALRIFDEVAISPSYRRKADPIIVGKIYAPKLGYQQKSINFLIAWHLDLREL